MEDLDSFSSWYVAAERIPASDSAQEIFNEALKVFKSELSKDVTKSQWIVDSKAGCLMEVLAAVSDARAKYEARKGDSPVWQCLSDFSEKIHYYGNIMDVMVQHHPEYVSLAWGAMKVLFVGVVNHERLLTRLSTGLCQIGDVLPRLELTTRLYPTRQIKCAVIGMYALILKFLIRSLRWYQESRLSHAIHSITRPAELRYDDLIEKISYLSRNVTYLALASSHAEQRDMHIEQRKHFSEQKSIQKKIDYLTALVVELKDSVVSNQMINSSTQIELRQTLSEIQLNQFITFISTTALLDPLTSFQSSLFMRNKRRLRKFSSGPAFWLTPRVQAWNHSPSSSLVMIKGTRKIRFHIKDFCADSIGNLRNSQTPTLWVLKTLDNLEPNGTMRAPISTIDLLKSLISQAIRLNPAIHTDAALCPRLKTYLSATTESDWFNLLASVLQGLPLVYIIIDVETVHPSLANLTADFSWPEAFLKIFSAFSARNIKTILKVILVSYGSSLFGKPMSVECQDLVVPVGGSARSGMISSKRTSQKTAALARGRKSSLPFKG